MGKTGTMHAWEQEGISGPDIQTVGKALGGGFIPLSGVFLREKIFEALSAGSGGLAHGHTFQVSQSKYGDGHVPPAFFIRSCPPLGL
jgi:adenosylmethionine-8-amino-7-oxononanoate aminotransferase